VAAAIRLPEDVTDGEIIAKSGEGPGVS
jgi:hypothetical protein